jgi:hypothetical protein
MVGVGCRGVGWGGAGQRLEIAMRILKLPCRKSDPVASNR